MPLTPVIDSAIPQQNFELIRDRIGGILMCEFLNQNTNFGLPAELTPSTVGVGRFVDVDDEDFPMINVRLFKGKYTDKEGMPTKDYSGQAVGCYSYVIDIVTGHASDGTTGGDELASRNLDRMMGIVWAILEDTRYCTLGFDPDTINIRSAYVDNFFSNIPQNTVNTSDFIWGKIYFEVEAVEEVALPQPVDLEIANVTVGLFKSDKGYYWSFKEKKIAIVADGDTLTNSFFSVSINQIDLIGDDGKVSATYILNTDFTQSGTTITAATFSFVNGTQIIAKT